MLDNIVNRILFPSILTIIGTRVIIPIITSRELQCNDCLNDDEDILEPSNYSKWNDISFTLINESIKITSPIFTLLNMFIDKEKRIQIETDYKRENN